MVARLAGIVALALAASAGGARAESGRYAVSFAGLGAGTLSFEATQSGDRYSVSGAARPGGVLGMLFDAKVDSQAAGMGGFVCKVNGNPTSGTCTEIYWPGRKLGSSCPSGATRV